MVPRARSTLIALLAVGLAVVAAGCGSDSSSSSTTTTEPAASSIKVALVTDIGGLNDKGFNALAYKGLQEAKAKYGVEGRALISICAAGGQGVVAILER